MLANQERSDEDRRCVGSTGHEEEVEVDSSDTGSLKTLTMLTLGGAQTAKHLKISCPRQSLCQVEGTFCFHSSRNPVGNPTIGNS